MLTETARVVSSAAGAVLVEAQRRSQCQSCNARQGCGHQLLNAMHWRRHNTIKAYSSDLALVQSLQPGDQVTIGIDEHLLLRSSLLFYLLPLFSMMLSAAVAVMLGAGERLSMLSALTGLLAGFVCLHRLLGRPHALAGTEATLLGRADNNYEAHIHKIKVSDQEIT